MELALSVKVKVSGKRLIKALTQILILILLM
jgi:hypothetical protein